MKWFQLVAAYCNSFYTKLIFAFDLAVHLHVSLWVRMHVHLGILVLCQRLLIQHICNLPVFVLHTEGFAQCCCFSISFGRLSVWGGIEVVLRWWGEGRLLMFPVPLVFEHFGVRAVHFLLIFCLQTFLENTK